MLFRARVVPPAGAGALSVAVQVEVPGSTTDVGLHVNALMVTTGGAVSERTAVWDELPRAAVRVAD